MFPIDQSYKLLSEEDVAGTLKYFARVELSPSAVVESLERELNLERLHADHLYRVRDGRRECIHHFEAIASYRAGWEDAQIEHAIYVRAKYNVPVFSHLLLMNARGVPRSIPERITRVSGGLRQSLRVNVIRLWRCPAAEVLKDNRIALYPWTVLMDATVEQQREAARRIAKSQREGLRMMMALLGGFRYGSTEAFNERLGHMLLTDDILRESPLWKEIEREGELRGKAEGQRGTLRTLLEDRFGPLPPWAEEKLGNADAATLRTLVTRVLSAPSLESFFD